MRTTYGKPFIKVSSIFEKQKKNNVHITPKILKITNSHKKEKKKRLKHTIIVPRRKTAQINIRRECQVSTIYLNGVSKNNRM